MFYKSEVHIEIQLHRIGGYFVKRFYNCSIYLFSIPKSTLSSGFRASHAWFKRLADGEGSIGSDFNLSITGDWGRT